MLESTHDYSGGKTPMGSPALDVGPDRVFGRKPWPMNGVDNIRLSNRPLRLKGSKPGKHRGTTKVKGK